MTIKKSLFKDFKNNKYLEKYLEKLPNFKEKKTQKFTTLILTLIAFSFFGFFAINPTLSTIAQLKKELADNQFVNESLEKKIQNLSLLQQKYALLKEDLTRLISAIPQSPTAPLFAAQLQSIAQSSNVTLTRLQAFDVELAKISTTTSSQNKQDDYSYFAFSLGVEGPYENLSDFISSFVNFDRIITIESLSLSKVPNKTKILSLSIRGKAYFKK